MPLSKKRNRDRMRESRATCVQPNPVHPNASLVQPKNTMDLKKQETLEAQENKKRDRARKKKSNSNRLETVNTSRLYPKSNPVRLEVAKEALADALQSNLSPIKEETNLPRMTEYNRSQFKPGDRVLVLRGKKWLPYLIPEVDGGGQSVPDYY